MERSYIFMLLTAKNPTWTLKQHVNLGVLLKSQHSWRKACKLMVLHCTYGNLVPALKLLSAIKFKSLVGIREKIALNYLEAELGEYRVGL